MPRILGVDIPKEKRTEIALTYLYGIGRTLSNRIIKEAQISPDKRAKDLTEEEIVRITNTIQKNAYKIEGDLRRDFSQNIKRLTEIGSWRGLRHRRGLPVRGQRTRTNARTRKGPRRAAIAIVKKTEKDNNFEYKNTVEALKKCHLLFICSSEKDNLFDIIDLVKNQSVLTVGETPGMLKAGGIINFLLEENKVRFEINLIAARQSKLTVRSQLLRLAKTVIEDE